MRSKFLPSCLWNIYGGNFDDNLTKYHLGTCGSERVKVRWLQCVDDCYVRWVYSTKMEALNNKYC